MGLRNIALAAIGVFFGQMALAYTPTVSPTGTPVRWTGTAKLHLAGNPINQPGFGDSTFFDAGVRSWQRWKNASRPNSWRLLPSLVTAFSTIICVAMPAWSVPGSQQQL